MIRHDNQRRIIISTAVFQCLNVIRRQCDGRLHALAIGSMLHTYDISILVIDKRCMRPIQMNETELLSRKIHAHSLRCQIFLKCCIIRRKGFGIGSFRIRYPEFIKIHLFDNTVPFQIIRCITETD